MAADPGSFRDPDSRVVIDGGRVFRELSARGVEEYEAFAASKLAGDERVVATTRVSATRLEHARIPFVSYPYEWTFGMLKAAALLQLDLLDAALAEGLTLKDATPYNVQFAGTRPVFIDVGSFERLRPQEPWVGYRQFCTLFLYPLMLTAYRGVAFQPWLRGSLEGVEPADAAALLPRRRRGVSVNARLLARLERSQGETSARATHSQLAKAGFKPEIIRANVRRLRKVVLGLKWEVPRTAWTDYQRDYTADDLALKEEFVSTVASRVGPSLTWDLGANDGRFSRLVGGQVVAMEADHATAELLYRSGGDVLPLVVDVADPSPARGWALRERPSLLERARPQLTLSLALIHHLAITRNVPLDAIVEWLASIGGTHVIEFPHRDDPRVGQLLAAKPAHDTRPDYDVEPFERALRERLEVSSRLRLHTRTLYEATAR